MMRTVEFILNRKRVRLETDDGRMLLWVLRSDLALTGTKYGCGEMHCGACTVVVDGRAARSCQTPLKDVAGKEVLTIEGLERKGTLHPLQKAFAEHGALQCGYCTPGMIMNAYGLLLAHPSPTEADIVEAMEGNLCRCGSHMRIVQAIRVAARELKGGRR
jgi:aerobic-type carbon monoxide dehydrogenase small subunit (CoxS/CutS family)